MWSWSRGRPAPADPWGGDTLEWSTSSPPPEYNFAAIPVVHDRHPMWDDALEVATSGTAPALGALGVEGAVDRATPITSGIDTLPQADNLVIPPGTTLPLLAALGLTILFVGLLISAPVVGVVGVGLAGGCVLRWAWRTEEALT